MCACAGALEGGGVKRPRGSPDGVKEGLGYAPTDRLDIIFLPYFVERAPDRSPAQRHGHAMIPIPDHAVELGQPVLLCLNRGFDIAQHRHKNNRGDLAIRLLDLPGRHARLSSGTYCCRPSDSLAPFTGLRMCRCRMRDGSYLQ